MTEHPYLSTACFHEFHGNCRKCCKFCDAPCTCPCHEVKAGETEVNVMVGEEWPPYIDAPIRAKEQR